MSMHQKDWLKLLGGAALLATGAGAAGIGPLAGLLGGEAAAGAGATAAAGGALAGEGAVGTAGLTTMLGSGASIAPGAALGGATATGAGAGLDFAGLVGAGAKGAAGAAGAAGANRAINPPQEVTQPGSPMFSMTPPQAELPMMKPGMSYQQQLQSLGLA